MSKKLPRRFDKAVDFLYENWKRIEDKDIPVYFRVLSTEAKDSKPEEITIDSAKKLAKLNFSIENKGSRYGDAHIDLVNALHKIFERKPILLIGVHEQVGSKKEWEMWEIYLFEDAIAGLMDRVNFGKGIDSKAREVLIKYKKHPILKVMKEPEMVKDLIRATK
ncbi:MAG: hypothetical protein ABIG20_01895 [archaeon]